MRVACVQMCSGQDIKANLAAAAGLLAEAAGDHVQLAILPENFAFMSGHEDMKKQAAESPGKSRIMQFLSDQAKKHGMAIAGGTIALKTRKKPGRRNACPVFDANGQCLGIYDKIHLFDVSLPGDSYQESALVVAGNKPLVIQLDTWRLGLSVCYDLRFPELYRHYARQGCQLIIVAAAFTVPTGEAHWEVLLRARAIENQAYVLAAAQGGAHPCARHTWGHSMVVDPWGKILAACDNQPGLAIAELHLAQVSDIRAKLPALAHRRMGI